MNTMKAYQMITDQILEMLNEGTIPWQQPYLTDGVMPTNVATKNSYHGINVMSLGWRQMARGYELPYWVGFNQARAMGGSVKKGEKGSVVVFFKMLEKDDGDTVPLIRYSYVWNIAQCDMPEEKLPEKPEPVDNNPIEQCERIVAGYDGPEIVEQFDIPHYSPAMDQIGCPPLSHFVSSEEYYSTIFHELVHSTGHQSRLARDFGTYRQKEKYSFEELVAELGASFLCGITNIEKATIENSAAYIKGWLSKLEENPRWMVQAASKAEKAANYIRGIREQVKEVAA